MESNTTAFILKILIFMAVYLCFYGLADALKQRQKEINKSDNIISYHKARINKLIIEGTPDTISYKYWSNICDSLDRKIHE